MLEKIGSGMNLEFLYFFLTSDWKDVFVVYDVH